MKTYPMEILNVGGDDYILMSWGHHDFVEFMDAVAECYPDWPMGKPEHEWFVMHPKKGCSWAAAPCEPTHPKARPATVTYEAPPDEIYSKGSDVKE